MTPSPTRSTWPRIANIGVCHGPAGNFPTSGRQRQPLRRGAPRRLRRSLHNAFADKDATCHVLCPAILFSLYLAGFLLYEFSYTLGMTAPTAPHSDSPPRLDATRVARALQYADATLQ